MISQGALNNTLRNAIFKSKIDENISLTNEQIEILSIMSSNNLFLSAPTSFGKTFLVLEYIKRNTSILNNIIFIVPTLALMNELLRKIYDLFGDEYNICINQEEDFSTKNFFIFVPERSDIKFLNKVKNLKIDLLIFDEIYKLKHASRKELNTDDRILLMNKVYLQLIDISSKVFLLGPFIKEIHFYKTQLDIVRFYTNYLPVYNEVEYVKNTDWYKDIDYPNELIYFSSPQSIYASIDKICDNVPENEHYMEIFKKEIDYLTNNIGSSWYVVDLLKRGIGIHHGKTPMYLRKFYENAFNKGQMKILLCTNTLMEGINTPTQRLIITDDPGSIFKLNNLMGRVGRLNPKSSVIGQIIIANDKAKEYYKNINKWSELTIVAEDEKVETEDEILFLNKKPNSVEQETSYKEKLDYLKNRFTILEEDIKKLDVRISKVYEFAKDNYITKLNDCNDVYEIINIIIPLLGRIGYIFNKENFKNIGKGYLPYKRYIIDLLNGNSIKDMVQIFNSQYNTARNKSNINLFIDKIFELRTWIKFKLSKILNYFELFNLNINDNKWLKIFVGLLTSFCEKNILDKVLEDLGIEDQDISKVKKIIKNDKISTSNVIREIRKNRILLDESVSPFTKNNIANI